MTEHHSLRRDARWLITLVLGTAFTYALIGIHSLALFFAFEGRGVPDTNLQAGQAAGLLQLVLFLAGAIVWLVWQFRFTQRLQTLGRQGMKISPGWSVAWYLIPIAQIAMAPQVMRQNWQASDPEAGPADWTATPTTPLVYVWWAVFLIGNAISRVGAAAGASGERGPMFLLDSVSALFVMAAGIMAVVLIRGIEARTAVMEQATAADDSTHVTPRTADLVLGAVLGAVVAVNWLPLMWSTMYALRMMSSYRIMVYPLALVTGIIAGYFVVLSAGARHVRTTIAAAAAGALGMYLTGFIIARPALDAIAYMARNPAVLITAALYLFRTPIVLTTFVLAVFAGAALAHVGSSAALRLVQSRRPGAHQSDQATRLADRSTAPMVDAAPALAADDATAPLQPIPPAPPTIAAAAARVPTAATEPNAADRDTPVVTAAPVEKHTGLGAGWRPDRRFLLVAATSAGLIVVLIAAFALGRLTSRTDEPAESSQPVPQEEPAEAREGAEEPAIPPQQPQPDQGGAAVARTPEEAVEWLYDHASEGDIAGAKKAFQWGFDIDNDTLNNWGTPDYSIQEVDEGDEPGERLVQVYEPGGGFSDDDVVTWFVREEDPSGWTINGWGLGTIEEVRSY